MEAIPVGVGSVGNTYDWFFNGNRVIGHIVSEQCSNWYARKGPILPVRSFFLAGNPLDRNHLPVHVAS